MNLKEITSIVMSSVGIIIHICGLLLLYMARKTSFDKTQRLILINLSSSELLQCFYILIRSTFTVYMVNIDVVPLIVMRRICLYTVYMLMIFLTFERFMKIYLNIRYSVYWFEKRTRIVLGLSWVTSIIMSCLSYFYEVDWKTDLITFLSLNFILLLVGFVTYGYSIFKLCQSYKRKNALRSSMTRKQQQGQIYKAGTMSFLTILTFVLFVVTPDLIEAYNLFIDKSFFSKNIVIESIVFHSYHMVYITDPIIYVLFSPAIRQIIYKMWLKKASSKVLPHHIEISIQKIASTTVQFNKKKCTKPSTLHESHIKGVITLSFIQKQWYVE